MKRWFSEVQSAVKSKSTMVQYHALGLLHQIKRNDRLAVSKLVSEMTRSPVRSHYAHCLLIRYTCQVLEDESDDTYSSPPQASLFNKAHTVIVIVIVSS